MAPAVKKQRVGGRDASTGSDATAYPDVEIKREENDEQNSDDDDDETPMSIIAQFQSEDVRALALCYACTVACLVLTSTWCSRLAM